MSGARPPFGAILSDHPGLTFAEVGGFHHKAELRRQSALLAARAAGSDAAVLLFWNGKPLLAGAPRARLATVQIGHPALGGIVPDNLIWLGEAAGRAWFAADLAHWQPAGVDAAATAAFFDPTEQQHPDFPPDHAFCELRGVMTRLPPLEASLAAMARALIVWHTSHGFCARCGMRSERVEAGWQRHCPACGAHHFPRTDPVVIMLVTRGDDVLVGRSHGWPDGMFSLLAGFVEPGETIEAAVRREVLEEVGVTIGQVGYLASQPWPFPASLMIGCHGIAETTALRIDPVEIEAAQWVSRERMISALDGGEPALAPARTGSIARYLIEGWVAGRWGAR